MVRRCSTHLHTLWFTFALSLKESIQRRKSGLVAPKRKLSVLLQQGPKTPKEQKAEEVMEEVGDEVMWKRKKWGSGRKKWNKK